MEKINQIDWELINSLLPGYSKVLSLKYIRGLTNYNFLLRTDSFFVFYKLLNTSFGEFIDRKLEAFIIQRIKHFPKIYYLDEKTCIRDFFENARPIHFKELAGDFGHSLIQSLLTLHEIGREYPESRKPKLISILSEKTFFESIRKYVADTKPDHSPEYYQIIEQFEKCCSTLLAFCKQYEHHSFLCHNDLTLENMLILKKTEADDEFLLLDYEYADFNIVFYEFANLFMEMEVEYTQGPPFFIFNKQAPEIREVEEKIAEHYLSTAEGQLLNLNTDEFLAICDKFKVFSHMFWVTVAIKSLDLNIPFDFHKYILCRFKAFNDEFDKHFGQSHN